MKNLQSKLKRNGTLLLLTLTLIIGIIGRFTPSSWAQPTEITITNPDTGDGNFIFYTNTTSVGTRFNATAWVDNVTDLFAYQVYLEVNDTLLNITNAWLPTWDPNWVFYDVSSFKLTPAFYDNNGNGYMEAVLVGDTILMGDPFNGSGLLAVIEFEIIYEPTEGSVSCNLDIDNLTTSLLDSTLASISTIKTSGYYEYFGPAAVPVPTIKVEPEYYKFTHIGETFNVTVKIENLDASLRMIGYGPVRIRYNNSLVEVLNITEGPFLPSFNQTPILPYTYFMPFDQPDDPFCGTHVLIGDLLLPNATGGYPGPFPEGNGTLATITFNVTGKFPGSFNYTVFESLIIDASVPEIKIPHNTEYGSFELYALTVTITDQPETSYGAHTLSIASMKFVVQYPNGTYYKEDDLGSVPVGLYNGTHYIANFSLTADNFDPATNKWTVEWPIPDDASLTADYSFVIRTHEVNNTVGETGPLLDVSSTIFKLYPVEVLDVQMDVGSIHFKGEKAEFSILTLLKGKRFAHANDAAGVTATLYKPDGTNETLAVTYVTIGFFKATYTIPVTDPAGTYTLMVEVSFIVEDIDYGGAAIKSFLVSPTLTGWDPMITYINGTIATIQTKLGEIQFDLQEINATVVAVSSTVATIETDIGTLQTSLNNINATVVKIEGDVATIETSIGTVQTSLDSIDATITDIDGDVATILTSLGEIETKLENINATVVAVNSTMATIETSIGTVQTSLDSIDATITDIDGDVVTIQTTLGEIKTTLEDIQGSIGGAESAATTTLYVASALSAIAVVIGIIILLLIRKK